MSAASAALREPDDDPVLVGRTPSGRAAGFGSHRPPTTISQNLSPDRLLLLGNPKAPRAARFNERDVVLHGTEGHRYVECHLNAERPSTDVRHAAVDVWL